MTPAAFFHSVKPRKAKAKRAAPLGYRAALQWLIDNDDTEWLRDDDPMISVTACLIADIYDRATDEVIADLLRMYGKATA